MLESCKPESRVHFINGPESSLVSRGQREQKVVSHLFSISFAQVISVKAGAATTVPKMNSAREKRASIVTCNE